MSWGWQASAMSPTSEREGCLVMVIGDGDYPIARIARGGASGRLELGDVAAIGVDSRDVSTSSIGASTDDRLRPLRAISRSWARGRVHASARRARRPDDTIFCTPMATTACALQARAGCTELGTPGRRRPSRRRSFHRCTHTDSRPRANLLTDATAMRGLHKYAPDGRHSSLGASPAARPACSTCRTMSAATRMAGLCRGPGRTI
jgi:hypothetical protein